MQPEYNFTLPFPPSVNGYWRTFVRGKRAAQIISEKGREYREKAQRYLIENNLHNENIRDRLQVKIILNPPCARKRDLDNYAKCLLDAITKSKFWEDDSQIDDLQILRGKKIQGGNAEITVRVLNELLTQ